MSISETTEPYRQRSKLWINNAKWNYQAFYSIYRGLGVRKLVIPVGIIRSERVNNPSSNLESPNSANSSFIKLFPYRLNNRGGMQHPYLTPLFINWGAFLFLSLYKLRISRHSLQLTSIFLGISRSLVQSTHQSLLVMDLGI